MRDNLHIFWSFNKGGAEYLILDILREQSGQYDNTIVIINNDYDLALVDELRHYAQVKLINRLRGSYATLIGMVRLPLLAVNFRRCFLHNSSLYPLFYLSKNCYVVIHGYSESMRYLSTKKTNIIAVSKSLASYLFLHGYQKVSIIENGVDVTKIDFEVANNSTLRVVTVGRLNNKIKGQSRLLEALSSLPREYLCRVSVDIIGEGEDLEMLKNLSQELGVNACISWLGGRSRESVRSILSGYDLVVFTSFHETFGLALIEAMASGCGVITSKASGFMEITNDGALSDGTFQTVHELSELIATYIVKRTGRGELLRRRKHVEEHYSIQKTIRSYNSLK